MVRVGVGRVLEQLLQEQRILEQTLHRLDHHGLKTKRLPLPPTGSPSHIGPVTGATPYQQDNLPEFIDSLLHVVCDGGCVQVLWKHTTSASKTL